MSRATTKLFVSETWNQRNYKQRTPIEWVRVPSTCSGYNSVVIGAKVIISFSFSDVLALVS